MKVLLAGLFAVTLAFWWVFGDDPPPVAVAPHTVATPPQLPIASTLPVVRIEPGPLRLEGQAIDATHQPIAGATITLAGVRMAITEQDGSFAFDGLAAGTYALSAERDGMYGEAADETLDDTSEPVMIKMRHGPALVVRVIAQDGTPVRDAKVSESRAERTTDAAGIARFRGLELGTTFVQINAPGFAPQQLRVELGDRPDVTVERTVRLDRGVAIEGIVVDDREQRVPGARVRIEAPGERWSESVDADDAGHFRFESIGAGRHGLHASGARHIEVPELIVDLDGRPRADLVVRVHVGAEVAGVVVDAHGRGVKGASVRVGSGSAESDDTGRFLVQGLEPGTHDVSATTAHDGSALAEITLARGARATTRIQIVPSSIAGVVHDVHGQPVEDVFVWLTDKTTEHRRWAVTDEAGRFDAEGVPPGVYEVTAERRLEPSRETSVVLATVRTPARRLALVVPDALQIAGRVILDGAPVTHYGVSITEASSRLGSPDVVNARDGRFERTDITPGAWTVVVAGPSFANKLIEVVVRDRAIDLGDIVVDRGRTLGGRVVDERGAPLAGAVVEVSGNGNNGDESLRAVMDGERIVRTDRDGRYQIVGLSADDGLRISATHARGMSRAARLPVDARTYDLVIAGAGAITGRIDRMTTRQFIAYAESIDDDAERYSASIDGVGGFELARLPAGDYMLSVYGENTLAPRRVTVRADQTTAVVFEMSSITPTPE